jgi:hypothetical protein
MERIHRSPAFQNKPSGIERKHSKGKDHSKAPAAFDPKQQLINHALNEHEKWIQGKN